MVRKAKDVSRALLSKGFELAESHHHLFEYRHGGKLIAKTHMSHNNQEINNHLIGKMSKQCQLDKGDFLDLVDCPLDEAGYIKKLQAKGLIPVAEPNAKK